jgi:hypothetical protein
MSFSKADIKKINKPFINMLILVLTHIVKRNNYITRTENKDWEETLLIKMTKNFNNNFIVIVISQRPELQLTRE